MVAAQAAVAQPGATARSYRVGSFDTVASIGPNTVIVHLGGAPAVTAQGPAATLDKMEVVVERVVVRALGIGGGRRTQGEGDRGGGGQSRTKAHGGLLVMPCECSTALRRGPARSSTNVIGWPMRAKKVRSRSGSAPFFLP
jgi:hypothetical protein